MPFVLPHRRYGRSWTLVLDSAAPGRATGPDTLAGGQRQVHSRSLVVLRRTG